MSDTSDIMMGSEFRMAFEFSPEFECDWRTGAAIDAVEHEAGVLVVDNNPFFSDNCGSNELASLSYNQNDCGPGGWDDATNLTQDDLDAIFRHGSTPERVLVPTAGSKRRRQQVNRLVGCGRVFQPRLPMCRSSVPDAKRNRGTCSEWSIGVQMIYSIVCHCRRHSSQMRYTQLS